MEQETVLCTHCCLPVRQSLFQLFWGSPCLILPWSPTLQVQDRFQEEGVLPQVCVISYQIKKSMIVVQCLDMHPTWIWHCVCYHLFGTLLASYEESCHQTLHSILGTNFHLFQCATCIAFLCPLHVGIFVSHFWTSVMFTLFINSFA